MPEFATPVEKPVDFSWAPAPEKTVTYKVSNYETMQHTLPSPAPVVVTPDAKMTVEASVFVPATAQAKVIPVPVV